MDILITSIVDLRKSSHNRLHQFIKCFSENHKITVLSINDYWKGKQIDQKCHEDSFDKILKNVDIFYMTSSKLSPYWQETVSLMNIYKFLRKGDYDVHFNYNALISGLMVSSILKSKKINTVYDIADNLPDMIRTSPQVPAILRPLGGFLGDNTLKLNIETATKVTIVTKFLEEISGVPSDKSEIIPNGVDTRLFKNYELPQMKPKLELDHNFIIGYVGVLREWVDFEPVFAAIKKLNKNDIKILIVGKEGKFNETRNLANKYGIEDKVIFTGAVPYEDVPKYISCMDICLIPFLKNKITEDPCPLKLFEYMACEKPVISTVYTSAVGNRILYASNVREYHDAILELYHNEDMRKQLGQSSRSFVEQFYDWSKISSRVEEVLVSVAT